MRKHTNDDRWAMLSGPTPRGCYEWTGTRNHAGYGVTWGAGGRHARRRTLAHRWFWQQIHGPIPAGLIICHRCDNPACCNNAHMFIGTHADNYADCRAKGRAVFPKGTGGNGERSPAPKLTNAKVRQIRLWLSQGYSCREIGRHLGVSGGTINAIKRGQTWAGIEVDPAFPCATRYHHGRLSHVDAP